MSSQQNFVSEGMSSEKSKSETIRQLAKRHMMDQYHTTTDEELKNAVVELELDPFTSNRTGNNYSRKYCVEIRLYNG